MSANRPNGPVVLVVRDGWGRNPNPAHDPFNAVKRANTPECDKLLRTYPWTLIKTSGEDVGLPEGTMGNSEVGHQNLGAGRILDQESVRITKAIRTGTFFENQELVAAVEHAKQTGRYVHLMGIASDAGVHGLMTHLYACLELCKKVGHDRATLHLFTDGRDTGPFTGAAFLTQIEAKCAELGVGQIVSICGRYYAMDRDNRWERVALAYDLITGRGEETPNAETAVQAAQDYYDQPTNDSQQGDEFITPRTVGHDWRETRIRDGDSIIFYNYRGDRPRELTRAFVMDPFEDHVKPSPETGAKGFDRGPKLAIRFVTMTAYDQDLNDRVHVAFPKPPKMTDVAGRYLSRLGVRQFRCAETEKFPHVTFFFNDYEEQPFDRETWQMAQSPQVATYDLKPEMSARPVCDLVLERLAVDDGKLFILVNFANGDMVGHTGSLEATIKAVETVDQCVGQIVEAALARHGTLIVTADHGNAEQMFDPKTSARHTAHTTYDVECILVDPSRAGSASRDPLKPSENLRSDGRLADVFPTVLELMGLDKPDAMRGYSLLR